MRLGLVIACLLLSVAATTASARLGRSELDHELYRELHRGQQSRISLPSQPTVETLACHERLAKVGYFVEVSTHPDPIKCPVGDLVRLDQIRLPDQAKVTISP